MLIGLTDPKGGTIAREPVTSVRLSGSRGERGDLGSFAAISMARLACRLGDSAAQIRRRDDLVGQSRDAVQAAAAEVLQNQAMEVGRMQAWLADWGEPTTVPETTMAWMHGQGVPLEQMPGYASDDELEIEVVDHFVDCPCGIERPILAEELIGHVWVCSNCGHVEEVDEADDLALLEVTLTLPDAAVGTAARRAD